MALRRHLPEGCVYRPADLYQWTSDVRAADIDANIFPEGTYDCVALLGVIEYLTKPQLAFGFARRCASAMVISYCYPLTDDLSPRQKVGWVNALSKVELAKLLDQNGWHITQSETFHRSPHTHQMIHALRKTE